MNLKKLLLVPVAMAALAPGAWADDLAAGTYYLRNNTSRTYLSSGAYWGTRSTLSYEGIPIKVTVANGAYTLVTDIVASGRAMRPSDAYMDQSGTWTIETVDGGYKLYNGSQYLYYDGTYIPQLGTPESGDVWSFLTKEDRIKELESATAENPVNATFFITSPDFLYKDETRWTAWSVSQTPGGYTVSSTLNHENPFNVQFYNYGSFDFNQTLTGLPEGTYELSVLSFYRAGTGTSAVDAYENGTENTPVLYAGDKSTPIRSIFSVQKSAAEGGYTTSYTSTTGKIYYVPNSQSNAADCFLTDDYINAITVNVGSDGELKIGVKKEGATSGDWVVIDRFKLMYKGSATAALKSIIAESLATANAITGAMSASAKSKLDAAVSAASSLEGKTADELDEINTNLTTAISTAQKSVALYKEIATYAEEVTVKKTGLDAAGQTAFDEKVCAVNTKVSNGEYDSYVTYKNEVDAVYVASVKSQTSLNSDWTGVIANPHFQTSDVSSWIITGESPTVNTAYNNCEYYMKDFDMKQVISGMKKGTYEVSLQAFQRTGQPSADLLKAYKEGDKTSLATLYTTAQSSDVPNIYEYAQTTTLNTGNESSAVYNGTTYYVPNGMYSAQKYFDAGYYAVTAKAVVTEDNGDLSFGFKGNLASTGYAWLIFDNFTLKYISEDVLVDASESKKLLEQELPSTPYNKDIKANIEYYTTKLNEDPTNGTYYNALRLAIADAESSATAYISAKEKLNLIAEAMETTNVYTAKAKEEYYTTPLAKYNDYSLTSEEAEAIPSRNDFLLSAWDNVNNTYVINTWSTEGNNDGSNFLTPFFQYYTNDDQSLGEHTFTATIDNLTANQLYEVSAWSRTRVKNNATAAPYGVSLQVGDGTAINVCDASQIGTSQLYLQNSRAVGSADADGKLTIKYIVASDNNVSWLAFKNVNYTEAELASDEEIASVKAEAEKQSAYVIGFEKGEYAIYNNYSYIQPLEKANAILSYPTITESMYNDAKSKLESNNWTVNEEEVNAVYDGTFAKAENNGAPAGWTMSNNTLGGDFHSRAFNPDSRLSILNETCSGFFIRFESSANTADTGSLYYYGQVDGYTIPLKANTTYKLKVDAVAWNGTGTLRLNLYGPDGFTTLEQNIALTVDNDITRGKDNPTQYNMIFNTGSAAGNYTLRFQAPGDSNTPMAAITNVELYTYKPETRETEVGKFGTICLPYAFTPNGATLYSVDEIGEDVVKLTEATEVTGGIAYIYQADEAKQTFEYKDNVVSAPTAGTLTGYFVKHAATAGTYVLQTQGDEQAFYQVEEGSEPTIGAYRAYLTVPTTDASAALRISFDNETTGIEAVKALTDGKAEIYDLNGRKLNKLRKGINIVDGVKVIVK